MNRYAYETCQSSAEFCTPRSSLLKLATYSGPEVDQFLDGLTGYMVMSVLQLREDFTKLADEGQRMFLCLAGEVLFGPQADAELHADCLRIATEPF